MSSQNIEGADVILVQIGRLQMYSVEPQRIHHGIWSRQLMVFSFLIILLGIPSATLDGSPQGARTIVSDDFTNNRQGSASADSRTKGSKGPSSTSTPTRPKPRRTYRLASQPVTKGRPSSAAADPKLGITIWRLRPVTANDSGARVLVREKGKVAEWVPERVEADTMFREGDHVRLTIESPRVGYLYVVDRDLFADGTTGGAMLIYPWSDKRGFDNQVRPGKLVDIPAQEDDPSYFTARLSSPDQVGELLTIIVTTTPLDLPVSEKPFQISNVQMSKWEKMWGGQSDRFELESGAGETWTPQEQQAAARKGSRQLTRDDPTPQTIYRISAANDKAFLVNVRLRYSK
jgi:hypothetical protein